MVFSVFSIQLNACGSSGEPGKECEKMIDVQESSKLDFRLRDRHQGNVARIVLRSVLKPANDSLLTVQDYSGFVIRCNKYNYDDLIQQTSLPQAQIAPSQVPQIAVHCAIHICKKTTTALI